MRYYGTALTAALVTLAAGAAFGQVAGPQRERLVDASSFATTEVHIRGRYVGRSLMDTPEEGPSRITITYGQPHARGRKIIGGVVPFDRVWRFGANLATILRTDVDMILGGTPIPQGVYSLFALPTDKGWQLIVNKQVGQWGMNYDASKDLARIPLVSRNLLEPVESFTIYLIPPDTRNSAHEQARAGVGKLKIVWEKTELTTTWQAK